MRSSLAPQSSPQLQPEAGARWLAEPETSLPGRKALGPVLVLLAAFAAVIVFFPPEGRVAGPLHEFFGVLLGRATFMLPVALAVLGIILIVHARRPDVPLPRRRFAGVALIAPAVAASEQLIANDRAGTGLIGQWLSASLLDLFGGPLTTVLLVVLLGVGVWLAFDLKWPTMAPLRPSTDAES